MILTNWISSRIKSSAAMQGNLRAETARYQDHGYVFAPNKTRTVQYDEVNQ